MGYCRFEQRRNIIEDPPGGGREVVSDPRPAARPSAVHRVSRLQFERLPRPAFHHDRRTDGDRRGRRHAERHHLRPAADPPEPGLPAHQRRLAPRPPDRPRGGADQPVSRPGQDLARVGRADRRGAEGLRVRRATAISPSRRRFASKRRPRCSKPSSTAIRAYRQPGADRVGRVDPAQRRADRVSPRVGVPLLLARSNTTRCLRGTS